MRTFKEMQRAVRKKDVSGSVEMIKTRLMKTRLQKARITLDAMGEFVRDADSMNAIRLVNTAKRIAEMIPGVCALYDTPADVQFRSLMADCYVWLHSVETAPSSRLTEVTSRISQLRTEIDAVLGQS